MEDGVTEGNFVGFEVGENTTVVRSVAIDNVNGVRGAPYWATLEKGATLRDLVVVDNENGIWNDGWRFTLENVTIYGSRKASIILGDAAGSSPPRLDVARTLITENGAFTMSRDEWSFLSTNSYGNAQDFPASEPIDDTEGKIRRSISISPKMGLRSGECVTWVPESSPMHAAADGKDIGANVLLRTRNGEPTCERTWSRADGRFRCGATIPGVNDDFEGSTIETQACINVHRRLNFVPGGCSP
jgi:hypothetical protein